MQIVFACILAVALAEYHDHHDHHDHHYDHHEDHHETHHEEHHEDHHHDHHHEHVKVLKEYNEVNHEGYKYEYELSNHIKALQEGFLHDKHEMIVKGHFEYVDKKGRHVKVEYVADKEGYHPKVSYGTAH